MKALVFLILILSFLKANGQSTDSLEQHAVKTGVADARFTKEFSRIVKSYMHNFADLKSDERIISIIDTTYQLKLNFREINDARLTFEKQDINLSISFRLDTQGVKKLFNDLSSTLPQGFVYTIEYDAETKLNNYTFFKRQDKKPTVENYPEKIYLVTDANDTAMLTFLKYR